MTARPRSPRPAKAARPAGPPRRRRSAEEARRAILDAAERHLLERGPGGIRLQEIAAEVGVSHPAILHHFESREGLVAAVIERAMSALEQDLVIAFSATAAAPPDPVALLERVFETLADRGQARLVAWLVLSGRGGAPRGPRARLLHRVAEAVHARRRAGRADAGFEDTLFTMMLAAAAAFGDAISGEALRASAGLASDRGASVRFRRWLASLLAEHLAQPASGGPARGRARARPRR